MDMMTAPTRRPRFRRHRFGKPALVLQERDHDIVRLVSDHRFITSEEIQALIPGSDQTILRRLQKLFHAGHLDRPRSQKQRGNAKLVYALGQKGAQLLATLSGGQVPRGDWAEKNRQVHLRYLEHALMVSRFRTVLTLATRSNGKAALESWQQGEQLRDEVRVEHTDWTERIPVYPDAYFILRLLEEPEGCNRVHVFLEADRGTMTTKRYFVKMRGYWHFWRSGRQEKRFGIRNFLVLTITATPERAASLRDVTSNVDGPKRRGLRMFLFGSERSYGLAESDLVLSPMWATAGDEHHHSLLE